MGLPNDTSRTSSRCDRAMATYRDNLRERSPESWPPATVEPRISGSFATPFGLPRGLSTRHIDDFRAGADLARSDLRGDERGTKMGERTAAWESAILSKSIGELDRTLQKHSHELT